MTTEKSYRLPPLLALASLLFVAAHLIYEHLNGGVQSHHLLNRSDLPVISNWLGLIFLPILGWLFGARIRDRQASASQSRSSSGLWAGLVGALIYGAALAIAFELDASALLSSLFLCLFLLAFLFPVYRAEYALGFVVGMTITFGAVLPTLVAVILATLSVSARLVFRGLRSAVRRSSRPRDRA